MMVAAASAGCAHAPPPPPCEGAEPIVVTIKAGDPLNPDDSGQSFPTIVRVYLLKSANLLETTGADEVLRHDREVLGTDLLETQEVTVRPGTSEKLTFKRQDDARQIAVVGLFRAPTGNTWRAIEKLPAIDTEFCRAKPEKAGARINITLDSNRVVVNPTPVQPAKAKGAS
jgi:type VI secretion system VasD/TssJ family lipoprotein